MSETIDLQPVIEKLSKSEKKQEQTLGTELLVLQTTLKEGEDAEKAQALLDTKAKLDAFESTISTDNPMPELQTLIDKAQSDITILEAQQAAEEKAVTDETAGETKGLRDRLTTSSDPEKEFTSWWKGIGTSILSVLGIGTALTSAVSKAGGGEKTEATKGIFDKAKEWIMGIFGLDKEKTPAVVADKTSETAETETEKHVALAKELQTDLGIKFDSETAKERIPLMSYKTLLVMQSAAKQFPGLNINSTIRSKEANDKLKEQHPDDVDSNSPHLYGYAFDIGKTDTYDLKSVSEYLATQFTDLGENLIHEGTGEHLHIATNESVEGKTPPYNTDVDIKNALLPIEVA